MAEFLGSLLRLVFDLVLEYVFRRPGHAVWRLFTDDVDADNGWVMATGVVVFIVLASFVFVAALELQEFLEIDTCLDRGGKFDYDAEKCIYK